MLKPCKHSKCAICHEIKDREVFKSVLETLHPETFICQHAEYKVTCKNGSSFVMPSLEYVEKGKKRYQVTDLFTSLIIKLNKDNFEVVCTCKGECQAKPYVAEYNK